MEAWHSERKQVYFSPEQGFPRFSVSVTSLLAFCLLGRVSGAEYSHSAVWNSWSFNSFLTVGPGLSDLLLADIAGCLFAFDFGIHSGEIRMQESGSSVLNCVLQNTPMMLHAEVRALGAMQNPSVTLRQTVPDP